MKKLPSETFPVVGVGASAGGLEAFKRFITAIPPDAGMAYIFVQHLEPSHESLLTDILQRLTTISVLEVTNNVRVAPNHIYIIPSNKLLRASAEFLLLTPRPPKNEKNMPIDVLFRSLASEYGQRAVGIVLSGTGSDGTLGLKQIKDHGGISFAQEAGSASFSGMPVSAIDSGVVDFILTPEVMPAQLSRLFHVATAGELNGKAEYHKDESSYRQLLLSLKNRKGLDFAYYKPTTIRRRILRRLKYNKLDSLADYLSFFNDSKSEQDTLYQDLLIPVTDFFRDNKVFERLGNFIFPSLLKQYKAADPFRIWVAGCSTGQEAYSMAICMLESISDKAAGPKIQIFATDVSDKSIAKARRGLYSKKEVENISPDRLNKFFSKANDEFQIQQSIRDMCVFATHNFLKDPPYSKMSFISCRNVLIYMEPSIQKKALTRFHYSLNDQGLLLLGKSESTGSGLDLFLAYNKTDKIYVRKPVSRSFYQDREDWKDKIPQVHENDAIGKGHSDFQKSVDDLLLSQYTPPGVVVDDKMEIVQFRGSTIRWLESFPGKPSTNLLKMARKGLGFELRNAIHQVKESKKKLIRDNIPLQFIGAEYLVTIEVVPVPKTDQPHFLILFRDDGIVADGGQINKGLGHDRPTPGSAIKIEQIERLENELLQARDDMSSITLEQEAVNEQLQIANEELLSSGEELQSLNEELETSKEEIQSTNEELTTLNQELVDRNERLDLSRIYAESIVETIREPLIILDMTMRVKTANRSYYNKFRTSAEQTEGKPFYELSDGQWNIPTLRTMFTAILWDEQFISGLEITSNFNHLGERTMLLNASRIFGAHDTEQLLLVAIEDITIPKKAEADLKSFTRELERQVEERTGELKESNLSLQNSNENLEQFATIASHDLQEPLRKIRTFANIINNKYGSRMINDVTELVQKISLSAERMSTLVDGILNFSRIIDTQIHFEKTNLNDVLRQVMDDLELMISQKNASIYFDQLPEIEANPLQMNQLFRNLLSNALKFSRVELTPKIAITCSLLDKEAFRNHSALNNKTQYYEFVFGDNGIGFDEQFAEQIFLIFERLNARNDYEGSGIGLALCKKIVLRHHGEIFATSTVDQGTRFHVILPKIQYYKSV